MTSAILTFGKFKGQKFSDTPKWYQDWAVNQPGFMAKLNGDPVPPKANGYMDGHSRKSQNFEDRYFDFEMKMADKYDPSDKYGHYAHL